jgi:aspartate kinase
MEDIIVSDVELNADHGRITIAGLPDRAGNCSAVFEAVARGGIVVDMIVQNLTGAGRAELSFSVPRADLDRAAGLAREAVKSIDPTARVTADGDIAVLFVYGVGMRTHTGVARKMFGALAARDINIAMINTSEVCVSVVVAREHGPAALAGLRAAFEIE